MSFFEWSNPKNISEQTLLGIKDDLMAAHCRQHIAHEEYATLLSLMEQAGIREHHATEEIRRLEKLLEAIK